MIEPIIYILYNDQSQIYHETNTETHIWGAYGVKYHELMVWYDIFVIIWITDNYDKSRYIWFKHDNSEVWTNQFSQIRAYHVGLTSHINVGGLEKKHA